MSAQAGRAAPGPAQAGLVLSAWPCLTKAQREAVRRLSLSPIQTEYAGSIQRAIDSCEQQGGAHLEGLALIAAESVVGFVVLKRGPQAPDWVPADAVLVSGLQIDLRQQRRGHGRAALALLPGWVRGRWPAARRIVLSVDERNLGGIETYRQAGFQDDGIRIAGRIGPVRRMTLPLR